MSARLGWSIVVFVVPLVIAVVSFWMGSVVFFWGLLLALSLFGVLLPLSLVPE